MLRRLCTGVLFLGVLGGRVEAAPCVPTGTDLILTNTTCSMSGVFTFTSVKLTNSTITVNAYDGSGNKNATGNLELRAPSIIIDATSKITAKGAGYQTKLCGNGVGPSSTFSGTGDAFSKAGSTMTLTDAAGLFRPEMVGRMIVIAGATSAANNGTYMVTDVPTLTTVQYTNAAGVAQAFPGTWSSTVNGGGRGGCSVRDSGGGGGHFGAGGRGTIDNPPSFPAGYEEDCSQAAATPAANGGDGVTVTYAGGVATCTLPGAGGARAPSTTTCRAGSDGAPTVAGDFYVHSIYQSEFGSSGGDKGCLDGDGYDPAASGTSTGLMVAGGGGGRIVLAGVTGAGQVTINGVLDANGKRGCGIGNDSGGGGAGGTIVVAANNVVVGPNAVISAAGGLGGDTQGLSTDPTGECALPFQQNTQADDCGGGGGGGIVSVLSVTSSIDDQAVFNVSGAAGGVSTLCRGEAGGGVGELQISNGYVGEFCDGFDNDFDGSVDENLGTISCANSTVQACFNGVPQQCPPDVPACETPVTDSRSRFAIVVDTSGSMLGSLTGVPTFGDGSPGHLGLDQDGNGVADDSRLYKAKSALTNVISAYPDIDFALARYHQDTSLNRSCQLAHNFECNAICCSYDNPTNNTAPAPTPACTVNGGSTGAQTVLDNSPGDECINYAGNCGPPRRGADILVGFGADIDNYLSWLDGTETNFQATTTPGAFCAGGDCELRGTGPTPLANSLQAVDDYLTPIKACDLAASGGCRKYNTILLTDGAESCQGDPVAAATALRAKGINTFVVGFSTLPSETAQLNAVASAGGTGSAFLVGSDSALANALAGIVSNSIVFETCNNLDDDCDSLIDEDFPGKGNACDNGKLGVCKRTGNLVCKADQSGLTCDAAVGPTGSTEICNQLDDDCDGKIDEGTSGCSCIPQGEQCNGLDDDCDGVVDNGITIPCGTGVCLGTQTCVVGGTGTFGACTARTPTAESCNGFDDDCDGNADGFTLGCSNLVMPAGPATDNPGAVHTPPSACENLNATQPGTCLCHPGSKTCPINGNGMFSSCTGEQGPVTEICNGLDDDCDGLIDETPPITCTNDTQCTGSPLTPSCDNPSGLANMGTCAPADCSSNCGVGQLLCVAGVQTCNSTPTTNDDTCNGLDDNCNGQIDEGWQCADPDGPDNILGTADDCACNAPGQCNAKEVCTGAGGVVCQGQPIGQESCNCQDDNCNGIVDDGALCSGGGSCTHCQCALPCDGGEIPCPLGKKCVADATLGGNFCVADPCFNVSCPPDAMGNKFECQDINNSGTCVKSCDLAMCATGEVCIGATGECKPDNCVTFPDRCSATESCVGGTCVNNPCAGVTCPTDKYCVSGQCYGSCADVECPEGQRCRMGACEADPCGHACPFGQACDDAAGECTSNPCTFVTCPDPSQWCNPNHGGACEDDPCKVFDIHCPNNETCVGGTCIDPQSLLPDGGVETHVTTGGGGGCSTGGGRAGVLVGLALMLTIRRRRGGRS